MTVAAATATTTSGSQYGSREYNVAEAPDNAATYNWQTSSSDRLLFPLTAEDFTRIRRLIHRIAGISLSPAKKDLVYSRLARRLRARQLNSFAEYLQLLENGDHQEMEAFINALTTNMTSFFREAHHFPILATQLGSLPPKQPVTIWTCASSSGEEPYSIAMTVVEHYNSFTPPVRILATDIDTNMLERARKGVYPLGQVQRLAPDRLKRFFLKGEGDNGGFAKVKPELQALISFRSYNLLHDTWAAHEKFDVIFCRNVMIYFDKETQYRVLRNLAGYLRPNGLFFAGHSESFHHAADLFRLCGKTVYALRADSPTALATTYTGPEAAVHPNSAEGKRHAHQSSGHR